MTTKAMTTAGLKQLAKKANAAAAASETHAMNAVTKAIEAGEFLKQAKEKVDHGTWLDWLGENWHYKTRWAQSLMRLADRKSDVIESAQSVPHALRLIEDSESDPDQDTSNAHANAHLEEKNSQKQGSNESSPSKTVSGEIVEEDEYEDIEDDFEPDSNPASQPENQSVDVAEERARRMVPELIRKLRLQLGNIGLGSRFGATLDAIEEAAR